MKSTFLVSISLALTLSAAPLKVTDLTATPEETPRLSWKLESNERGKRQVGYHLLVASSADKLAKNEGDIWDKKSERDPRQRYTKWEGKTLKKGQTVHWKVKVWSEKGEEGEWSESASFVVGEKPASITEPLASFSSSDEKLNQIYANAVKALAEGYEAGTFKSNAEAHVVARAALFQYDCGSLFSAGLDQIDTKRTQEGYYPGSFDGSEKYGTGWSDAGVIVPYALWWMTGDNDVVSKRWPTLEEYMISREKADPKLVGTAFGEARGDQGHANDATPQEYLDMCYLALTSRLMMEMSRPAMKPLNSIRYQDYFARLRKNFAATHVKEDGSLKLDSQAAHILALRYGLLLPDKREKVKAAILADLAEKKSITSGILAVKAVLPVLTWTGNQDLAIELLRSEKGNTWLTGKGVFENPAARASVIEWMITMLGGIDTDGPGFNRVRVQPWIPSEKIKGLDWVKVHHDSPFGRVACHWKREGKKLTVEVAIPPNVISTVHLPLKKGQKLTESGKSVKDAYGAALIKHDEENGTAMVAIQSGNYRFEIE